MATTSMRPFRPTDIYVQKFQLVKLATLPFHKTYSEKFKETATFDLDITVLQAYNYVFFFLENLLLLCTLW